jgi:hypothetical protein
MTFAHEKAPPEHRRGRKFQAVRVKNLSLPTHPHLQGAEQTCDLAFLPADERDVVEDDRPRLVRGVQDQPA